MNIKRSTMNRSLLLSSLCLALFWASAEGAVSAQEGPRAVHVTQAHRSNIDRTAKLVGTVLPWQETTLRARVTGYVHRLEAFEGDRIPAGSRLLSLALPGLQAAEDTSTARLAEAQAQVAARTGDIQSAHADVIDAQAARSVASARVGVAQAATLLAETEASLALVVYERQVGLYEAKAATLEEVEAAGGLFERAQAELIAAQADATMVQAQLEASAARITAAEARVEAARAQITAAEAAVLSARAAVRFASAQLAFGELRAPYDETLITARLVDVGALARAEVTDLLMLMDVSRVRLQIHIPERLSRSVTEGTRVQISLDGEGQEQFQATVSRVAGALALKSRTMRAEVDLDNADGTWMPGSYIGVRLSTETIRDALLLPGSAIHTDRKQNFVLVVKSDGSVARVHVKLGIDDGQIVQIESGLTGEEDVIMYLVAGLREGDTVRAVQGERP